MQKIGAKTFIKNSATTKKQKWKDTENGHKKFELKMTVNFFPSKSYSKIVHKNLH